MAVLYIIGVIFVLIFNFNKIPLAIALIIESAFNPKAAFEAGLPIAAIGKYIVNIGLMFFAFTTILGWNYYGERCIEYLYGVKGIKPYKFIFIVLVGVGSFLPLEMIFIIADIVNGLMVLPNLVALIGLRKVVIEETENYFYELKELEKQVISA